MKLYLCIHCGVEMWRYLGGIVHRACECKKSPFKVVETDDEQLDLFRAP